jgi:hypothetical protein
MDRGTGEGAARFPLFWGRRSKGMTCGPASSTLRHPHRGAAMRGTPETTGEESLCGSSPPAEARRVHSQRRIIQVLALPRKEIQRAWRAAVAVLLRDPRLAWPRVNASRRAPPSERTICARSAASIVVDFADGGGQNRSSPADGNVNETGLSLPTALRPIRLLPGGIASCLLPRLQVAPQRPSCSSCLPSASSS